MYIRGLYIYISHSLHPLAPLAALSAANAVSDLELRVPRELRAFSTPAVEAPGDPVIETGVFPTKNGVKV